MRRTTSDLGVEAVLLCDLAYRDQLVRMDLTARNTRYDGERPVSLNVGEESDDGFSTPHSPLHGDEDCAGNPPVVCILRTVVFGLHDVVVVQRRQDTRHGGLADLAPHRSLRANGVHDGSEVAQT